MKKYLLFIVCFSFLNVFAQTKQFIYEYISLPDSTQKKTMESEIMVLNINKVNSEYFSYDMYVSDSAMLDGSKKGLWLMPSNKKMTQDRVLKINNAKQIKFITVIGDSKYFVDEIVDLKWKLHPEYITVLNYKAQKATTEFGGRNWTAWFAKDIPFQDGPYKFKGLPGLIIKIEDDTKSHKFELKGIKNLSYDVVYPDLNNFQQINIDYPKFVKIYKNYRISPMADMVGKFPDQTDSEGKFRTGQQVFRLFENNVLERLKKDNNIIEIELLKK